MKQLSLLYPATWGAASSRTGWTVGDVANEGQMLWNWTTIDACTFFVPSAPLSFESPFSMRTAAVQL